MSSEDRRYSCKRCRCVLFEQEHLLTSGHVQFDGCTLYYLNIDALPLWAEEAVQQGAWTKGKLICPECGARVGAFTFINQITCSCKEGVSPAVYVVKSKVDEKKAIVLFERSFESSSEVYGNRPGKYKLPPVGKEECFPGNTASSPADNIIGVSSSINDDCAACQNLKSQTTIGRRFRSSATTTTFRNASYDPNILPIYPEVYPEEEFSSSLQPSSSADEDHGEYPHRDMITPAYQQQRQRQQQPYQEPSIADQPEHHVIMCHPCQLLHEQLSVRSRVNNAHHSRERNRFISKGKSSCGVLDGEEEDEQKFPRNYNNEEFEELPDHHQCPVCLDIFYEPYKTKCLHVFCSPCLRQLNKSCGRKPKCPLCRERIYEVHHDHEFEELIKQLYPEKYKKRSQLENQRLVNKFPLPNPCNVLFDHLDDSDETARGEHNRVNARSMVNLVRYSALILLMVLSFLVNAFFMHASNLVKEMLRIALALSVVLIVWLCGWEHFIVSLLNRFIFIYVCFKVAKCIRLQRTRS